MFMSEESSDVVSLPNKKYTPETNRYEDVHVYSDLCNPLDIFGLFMSLGCCLIYEYIYHSYLIWSVYYNNIVLSLGCCLIDKYPSSIIHIESGVYK